MKDVRLVLLKARLNAVNEKIKALELRALIYSDRDREVVKECDAQLGPLNAEYLDIDDEIQTLERQVA